MHNHTVALLFAVLAPILGAQTERVANGDFTGTLAPWSMGGGYSVNAGLETIWNTTGLGVSDSFGVNAGLSPANWTPPSSIEQTVIIAQGLTYEFRCDASGARPMNNTASNADIGTIWVEVNGVEIARHAFGGYVAPSQVKRAQLCGRFSPTTSGPVTLRIYFHRGAYVAGASNPRMNIDNVSVKDVTSATFCIAGNRQLGTNVTHRVSGTPGALFVTFAALGAVPAGITFPGIQGALHLDPVSAVTLRIGNLDANGRSSTTEAIPNAPIFLQIPLHYQPGMWDTAPSLGLNFRVLASQ